MSRARRGIAALAAGTVMVSAAYGQAGQGRPAPPVVTGDSADLPMVLRGPQPALEVMVNGRGPFVFAIDTGGAGDGRVDRSLVTQLRLEQVGEARGSAGPGAAVQIMPIVRVETLAVGGITLQHLDLPSRDYNTSPNLPHIDGILGFNAFADFLLTLDYPHRRVRIERGTLPDPDGRTILSFDSSHRIPEIQIDVAGHTMTADLDTGNVVNDQVEVPAASARELPWLSAPAAAGRAQTVSGSEALASGQLDGDLQIGSYIIHQPHLTIVDGLPVANIGSGVLAHFVVTFDQKNRRVRLTPA
jgi:hypothetical protein